MKFSSLERAALSFLAESAPHPNVATQLHAAQPVHREFTGAGSFTELNLPPASPPIPANLPFVAEGMPLAGVEIVSPSLSAGACAMVWFKEGCARTLEVAGPGISDHDFPFSLRVSGVSTV